MAVAVVDVRVDSSSAVRNLQQLDAASRRSQTALDGFANRIAGVGAALAGGFAIQRVISDATELDRNLRRLGTVGMEVDKISPALSKLSDQLGGVANKADLAAASYQAASAGFADTAGNIQILNAATKAAVGGLADTQAVTEVLVKTLNAYGMSGTRAFEVTDSISKAVELGNQEWSDYTSLLGRVVSTAALAGVSIDQMNAFIASATKNGATAEVAFTGLGAVLNTLLQPTKESQDAAKKLGIQWNYGGLQAKGFTGLMAQLAVAMEKDKETTARLLGSQEAMRGAFAANAKGGKDFVMVLEQLSGATGKTDADFQTMKGSLENTIKALDTSFMNLSEALAKAFGPTIVITIQDITKSVNGFANVMNSIPQPVMDAVGMLIKFGIQMMLVKRAIDAVIALRASYVAATTAMATSTAATGTAATASSSAFALYTRNTQALAAQATASAGQVTALGAALRSLAAIGIITIGIQLIVSQVQDIATTAADVERMRRERAAGGMTREFGGAGATQAQRNRARKTIEQINAELQDLNAPVAAVQALGRGDIGGATQNYLRGVGITTRQIFSGRINPALGTIQDAQRRAQLEERRLRAQAILAMPERQDPLQRALGDLTGGLSGAGTAPPSTGGTTGGKGKADDAAKAAAEEQKRVAEIIRNRMAEAELIRIKSTAQDKIAQAEAAGDKQLAIRLQGQLRAIDLQYQYAQQLAQEKDIRAQTAIIYEGNTALVANQFETQRQLNEAQRQADQDRINALQAVIEKQYQMNTAVQQQLQFADNVANSIGQGMTSAFDALIRGSDDWGKSLQSIASGVLVDIANQLIKIYVIEQAINAIKTFLTPFAAGTPIGAGGGMVGRFGTFGPNYGIPQFANGGSIKANQLSLVGERGPELFMPGRSGTIIPNHNLGGGGISVVVNVDASGSSVSGDQTQGKQLGMAVSAAVQAELLKQKRPGGLLA